MPTPTLYMGLPNPTPFGDSGTWASEIVTCNTGFDTLAVSNFTSVSVTGSLSVYNGVALIQATGGVGGITLTLPDVTNSGLNAANEGRVYIIVKVDSGAGVITINPFSGGQTISGQSSITISNQWHGRILQSTNTGWVIIGIVDETTAGIVPVTNGGTGANLSATGGTSQVLRQSGVGANITVSQLAASDLSNGVTGTVGSAVVLTTSPTISAPTISGHPTVEGVTSTGATGTGNFVFDTSPSISGATLSGTISISGNVTYSAANPAFYSAQGSGTKVQLSTGTTTTGDVVTYDASSNAVDSGTLLSSLALLAGPTFTGTVTIPILSNTTSMTTPSIAINGGTALTTSNQTGTGNIVLATSPTISGHPTVEGVTSTGATGTGNFVFDTSPTISAPVISSTITSYNGLTTAGNGVVSIVAATSQKSESAADPSVLSFTPPAVAGTYRVRFVLSVSTASAAVLGWTITYKDSNGNAQAPTNVNLANLGTAGGALTYTTSSPGNYNGALDIDIDSSMTPIVVQFTLTGGTITAKVSSTIERVI